MKRSLTLVLVTVAFFIPSPAMAEDWAREVAGWDVGRVGDTCAMMMEDEGGGATRLGLVIQDDAADTYAVVTKQQHELQMAGE